MSLAAGMLTTSGSWRASALSVPPKCPLVASSLGCYEGWRWLELQPTVDGRGAASTGGHGVEEVRQAQPLARLALIEIATIYLVVNSVSNVSKVRHSHLD